MYRALCFRRLVALKLMRRKTTNKLKYISNVKKPILAFKRCASIVMPLKRKRDN